MTELTESEQRQTKKILKLVGNAFRLFGVVMILAISGNYIADKRIELLGDTASGMVLKNQFVDDIDADGSDNSHYYMYYRYELPDGRYITDSQRISKNVGDKLTEGSKLQVKYMPNNTSEHILIGVSTVSIVVLIGSLFMGFLAIFFGWKIKNIPVDDG